MGNRRKKLHKSLSLPILPVLNGIYFILDVYTQETLDLFMIISMITGHCKGRCKNLAENKADLAGNLKRKKCVPCNLLNLFFLLCTLGLLNKENIDISF